MFLFIVQVDNPSGAFIGGRESLPDSMRAAGACALEVVSEGGNLLAGGCGSR